MNPIENFSSKERGLLRVAAQHKGSVAFFETKVIPHLEASLVSAWAKNFCEEDVWNYIENARWNTWVKMNSSALRIFTTIKDYTNKKGETKPAHFTENGSYFGSIKQLGDKPVGYNGHFHINKEHFEAYLPKDPKCITDFFRPRRPAEEPAEQPAEEPIPVPKRKVNRPKVVLNDE